MRFLVWVLGVASLLWGGYWFIGARAVENGAETALKEAVFAGHEISYSALNTRGFPNRFDTTIEEIDVTTATGIGWRAPFFQLFALSYRPNHLIAVWPHDQQLSMADVRLAINSEDMRASLQLEANTSLALDRFTSTVAGLTLAADTGEVFTAQSLLIATRQAQSTAMHDLAITANTLAFTSAQGLSFALPSLALDSVLTFDRPIDRTAQSPRLLALGVREFSLQTEGGALSLSGDLAFDPNGYANGALLLTAQNWRATFAQLQRIGAIPPQNVSAFEGVLEALAAANAPSTDFSAPLTVQRGQIKLGFLPIGFLPPL